MVATTRCKELFKQKNIDSGARRTLNLRPFIATCFSHFLLKPPFVWNKFLFYWCHLFRQLPFCVLYYAVDLTRQLICYYLFLLAFLCFSMDCCCYLVPCSQRIWRESCSRGLIQHAQITMWCIPRHNHL